MSGQDKNHPFAISFNVSFFFLCVGKLSIKLHPPLEGGKSCISLMQALHCLEWCKKVARCLHMFGRRATDEASAALQTTVSAKKP